MDIGILGLGTSHSAAFASVLEDIDETADDDIEVSAVWDGGTVRDDQYVESFCADVGALRYEDPETMVDFVDAALVLGVDWERHFSLARPFLEAGVPTLVDKPVAGSLNDLDRIRDAAVTTPLHGGSAVYFHPAFREFDHPSESQMLHVAGYNDFFYYRSHTVNLARRIVGADWTKVIPRSWTDSTKVEVAFADGSLAMLHLDGNDRNNTFTAHYRGDQMSPTSVSSRETTLLKMYKGYLQTFINCVGSTGNDQTDVVIDAAELLLAVEAALEAEKQVTPDSRILSEIEKPSDEFVSQYEPYY